MPALLVAVVTENRRVTVCTNAEEFLRPLQFENSGTDTRTSQFQAPRRLFGEGIWFGRSSVSFPSEAQKATVAPVQ